MFDSDENKGKIKINELLVIFYSNLKHFKSNISFVNHYNPMFLVLTYLVIT